MQGMGTAFSSSLLGLAGSLILGFLELQASHAHNRFYNELEEWLSGITEISLSTDASDQAVNRQLAATIYDLQRVLTDLNTRLAEPGSLQGGGGEGNAEPVKDLARGVSQLINQMRSEQKIVREWVDEQASQQAIVTDTLRELAQNIQRRGS